MGSLFELRIEEVFFFLTKELKKLEDINNVIYTLVKERI
jgi:hypothetical protein